MQKQEIIIMAAVAKNGVIGKDGKLPWQDIDEIRRPDMQRFRYLTVPHPVIMGRKTYESIPAQYRPLPHRPNIVLSRDESFQPPGILLARSLDEALEKASALDEKVFIIGGAQVYRIALPRATKLEITEINRDFEGDAFFPPINKKEWTETSREPHVLASIGYSFVTYQKKNSTQRNIY